MKFVSERVKARRMSKFGASLSYSWQQGKNFTRGQWLRFSGWLAVIGALLAFMVAGRYLPFIQVSETHSIIYMILAFIGHFGFFVFLVWLLLLVPLSLLLPKRWCLLPVGFLTLFGGVALLAVDTTVYAQYRFHLSGFVWELLMGPGAGEVIKLSWFTLSVIALTFLSVALVSLWALSLAARVIQHRGLKGKGKYVFVSWVVALVGSQLMHVWYEAHYDAEVTGMTRHLPFYYPATAKRNLVEMGLIDPSEIREENDLKVKKTSSSLNYPLHPLQCTGGGDQPMNVLVIAIDAMRADAFTKEITPNLYALSQSDNAQVFTDHHSGGNVTKGGVFSLFFGLPPTYWDGFAAAQEGPLWIREQQAQGYRMGIFSSATLLSPAFDRTVFPSIDGLRLKSEGESPSLRDRDAIHDLKSFIESKPEQSPFFGFLFLDAAHGYDVPAGYEKFQPQWERVDHVKLNNDFDPTPYFNRYKNALFFIDEQVGNLINELKAQGVLENTLVILTSDHGEEFNDLGKNFWGHGSNFTQYQTKVPLMMLWPGKQRTTIEYRTSHYDVVPTLMSEVLGCENPASDYSVGQSLFDSTPERNWLLVHSYFNYGLLMKDRIIATYPTGDYEVLDLQNRKMKGERMPGTIGIQVIDALSKFYR